MILNFYFLIKLFSFIFLGGAVAADAAVQGAGGVRVQAQTRRHETARSSGETFLFIFSKTFKLFLVYIKSDHSRKHDKIKF